MLSINSATPRLRSKPTSLMVTSFIYLNLAARIREATKDKAEAEKILQIKKAEGEAESKYLAGIGSAGAIIKL